MFAFLCVVVALELFGYHLCGNELLYTRYLRRFCFCDFKFCVRQINFFPVLFNGCNSTPRKRVLFFVVLEHVNVLKPTCVVAVFCVALRPIRFYYIIMLRY